MVTELVRQLPPPVDPVWTGSSQADLRERDPGPVEFKVWIPIGELTKGYADGQRPRNGVTDRTPDVSRSTT